MTTHPLVDALRQNPERPAHHGEWTAKADGAESGPIGLQADRLRLRRDDPATRDAPELARKVAERATYLLEPLKLVESEADRALLRSDVSGDADAESHDFYDVWVTPDELSVERYHAEQGQPRTPRPVNLTWEQAERFVRDAESIYAEDEA